jgi:protein-S-isoprenylcysteine O-methyltransferase Ste14
MKTRSFVCRLKSLLRRVAAILLWCFYVFPTYVCVANPLIGMIAPVGVEWFLLSAWSPFYSFWDSRWLVFNKVSIPDFFGFDSNPIVGWSLLVAGLSIFLSSVIQFLAEHGEGLVMSGLYSKVRHPQYFGIIIATLGFTVASERPMSWIAWLTLTYMYVLLALREEEIVRKKYEREAQKYTEQVPFLLPLVSSKISKNLPVPRSYLGRYLFVLFLYSSTIIIACFVLKNLSYGPGHF